MDSSIIFNAYLYFYDMTFGSKDVIKKHSIN